MIRHLLAILGICAASLANAQALSTATFAGGCFWCLEEAFEKVPGVVSAVSGYTDGRTRNPSYEKLLDAFWLNHDPTTLDRQFCDGGTQYRPGIYWHDEEQKRLAEASKAKYERLKAFKQPIITPIVKASQFWPAEDYHQDYYKKNPVRYKFYSNGCGRYTRLDELWGKLRK